MPILILKRRFAACLPAGRRYTLMSVLNKHWQIKNTDPKASLLQKLLVNRGLKNETEIERFFHPNPAHDFHDPFLLKDMERAVARITQAIEKSERIMIFGDYDVDGITGTAILMRALKQLKANVSYRLPHRIEDGYGLREKFIREFSELNVKVAITVDNGISCAREAALAQELGIDLIISDHHTVPEILPEAYAILHPKLPGSGYPFTELTGAGVALKLAQAMFMRHIKDEETVRQEITHLLDLACMGTIADLGPLLGENRYIVKEGLRVLENTRWPGLSRLKEFAGVKGKIDTHMIGFLLGPRINAAGRISHPKHAMNLLLQTHEHSGALAETLEKLNRERQGMMGELMFIAEDLARNQNGDPLIVVSHPKFHGGIIGLIAAKLSEKYFRPAIVMDDRGKLLVGSCRSVPGVNVVQVLTRVKDILPHFGGHAAAAGFDLAKENLPAFTKRTKQYVKKIIGKSPPPPQLTADCEIIGTDICKKTLEILKWFAPFGLGNEVPRFLARNVPVEQYSLVGSEKQHLKMKVRMNGQSIDVIGFRLGAFLGHVKNGAELDMICELEENTWRGKTAIQLKIMDFQAVDRK